MGQRFTKTIITFEGRAMGRNPFRLFTTSICPIKQDMYQSKMSVTPRMVPASVYTYTYFLFFPVYCSTVVIIHIDVFFLSFLLNMYRSIDHHENSMTLFLLRHFIFYYCVVLFLSVVSGIFPLIHISIYI